MSNSRLHFLREEIPFVKCKSKRYVDKRQGLNMNEWHNDNMHYVEKFIHTLKDDCFDIFVTSVIKKLMNETYIILQKSIMKNQ